LNQDGRDKRMDQDRGLNQDGTDERMGQDRGLNQDGKVADFVGAYCISPPPAILTLISPFRVINSFILLGQIITPRGGEIFVET